MKVIGIIAEYNPFHNGHAYQIKKIKELTGADYIVTAISGDFVQRGTPAIIDKYARAEMALTCGADLVLELPVLWATASAESFAMAGVTLFDKMGCVDGLCFGAETDNPGLLSRLANILAEEPETYRMALTSHLKTGLSFPAARTQALCEYVTEHSYSFDNKNLASFTKDDLSGSFAKQKPLTFNENAISAIMNEPNNILAIEYLKALKRRNSSIAPYLIKREGAGYHETEISDIRTEQVSKSSLPEYMVFDNPASEVPTASATAIRRILEKHMTTVSAAFTTAIPDVSGSLPNTMPTAALKVLETYLKERAILSADDFSSLLGYKLLTSTAAMLSDIGDSNPEIANRLFKNRMQFSSFLQFCEENKSKDITYTRMSRILLHLILNLTSRDYLHAKHLDYIPYLRILGFKRDSSALFKEIKNTACIPLISKLADAAVLLDNDAMNLLKKDIFAADLYEQTCSIKKGTVSRSEFVREIVRV